MRSLESRSRSAGGAREARGWELFDEDLTPDGLSNVEDGEGWRFGSLQAL